MSTETKRNDDALAFLERVATRAEEIQADMNTLVHEIDVYRLEHSLAGKPSPRDFLAATGRTSRHS